MVKKTCLGILVAVLLIGSSAYAETFQVDLDASTTAVEQTLQVNAGGTVTANLVVTGAENLLGVSADVLFDATNALELTDIQATFGDLDFSSVVGFQEIVGIIGWYLSGDDVENLVDPFGNNSGIIVDKDRNGTFGFTEVIDSISQYLQGANGVQYWTTELATDTDRQTHQNESVPVFDPVAKSNVGGEHPGLIEDITAVLLRRPEGSEGGTTASGFGYDSSKYGNAIICTLKFKVKNDAPAGDTLLSFGKSVYISEDFTDIDTGIKTAANESSTIQVQ